MIEGKSLSSKIQVAFNTHEIRGSDQTVALLSARTDTAVVVSRTTSFPLLSLLLLLDVIRFALILTTLLQQFRPKPRQTPAS